jgi:hypothetical protein
MRFTAYTGRIVRIGFRKLEALSGFDDKSLCQVAFSSRIAASDRHFVAPTLASIIPCSELRLFRYLSVCIARSAFCGKHRTPINVFEIAVRELAPAFGVSPAASLTSKCLCHIRSNRSRRIKSFSFCAEG